MCLFACLLGCFVVSLFVRICVRSFASFFGCVFGNSLCVSMRLLDCLVALPVYLEGRFVSVCLFHSMFA